MTAVDHAPQAVLFPVRCARCDAPTGDAVCPDHKPGCGIDGDGCTCPPVCTDCCPTCNGSDLLAQPYEETTR